MGPYGCSGLRSHDAAVVSSGTPSCVNMIRGSMFLGLCSVLYEYACRCRRFWACETLQNMDSTYDDAKYMGVQACVMWAKKGRDGALDLKHLGPKSNMGWADTQGDEAAACGSMCVFR